MDVVCFHVNIFIAFFILAFRSVQGDIRCFCNDASCVNRSYMCKSIINKCFSLLTPDGASSSHRFIHGCADVISDQLRSACGTPEAGFELLHRREANPAGSDVDDNFRSRIVCCEDDMCNYNAENAQPVVMHQASRPKINILNSFDGHKMTDRKTGSGAPETRLRNTNRSFEFRQVWFRAAVIAVPIAGLLILIVLIVLAVRMLRGDLVLGSHVIRPTNQGNASLICFGSASISGLTVVSHDGGCVRTVLAPPSELTKKHVMLDTTKLKYEKFRPSNDCCHGDDSSYY